MPQKDGTMLWVVTIVAALAFWMLSSLVLPRQRWHWQVRLVEAIGRVRDRVLRRPDPPPDPFESLRLQSRLGVLASEIRSLESDPAVYAKRHRLLALRAAYDDLLGEGCRLAGIPGGAHEESDDAKRRWREEQELASRGWSW